MFRLMILCTPYHQNTRWLSFGKPWKAALFKYIMATPGIRLHLESDWTDGQRQRRVEALYLWPMLRDGVIKGIIIMGFMVLHYQILERYYHFKWQLNWIHSTFSFNLAVKEKFWIHLTIQLSKAIEHRPPAPHPPALVPGRLTEFACL